MFRPFRWLNLSIVLLSGSLLWADTAGFDLAGPRIELRVTRAGKTLPISKVPNLQAGDRLWIHPDLPDGESVRFLMISVFLRGSTNPPPDGWITKVETWNKHVREEGIVITVPEGAQQALIFLAPQTGGDFGALRAAVQGKPGAFVRASQDLNQASLDRSRLDKYLKAVKEMTNSDSAVLHDRSVLLARSLNIKLDNDCFSKPRQQQESCLTQNTDQLVLDDGHSQSMVAALTSGSGPDLVGQLSTTRLAGGGTYSPYVGAVVDLAKMMESFRSPEYRYIPALALPHLDELNLKLNNPPSFRKPMSVMVLSLPAVEAPQLPPLRRVDSNHILCLEKPSLLLAAEGAPVVFSTDYAHDLTLRIPDKSGHAVDLPVSSDAARGGFAIDTHAIAPDDLEHEVIGTIRGNWGFDSFEGPAFRLQNAHPGNWTLASADESALIVGRDNTLHLKSDAAACVDTVTLKNEQGKLIEGASSSPAGNEIRRTIGRGHKRVHHQPVSILRHQVSVVAQLCLLASSFTGQHRFRIRRRTVRLIAAFLSPIVDRGVVLVPPRRRRFRFVVLLILGHSINGPKALVRCPGLQQRPIHGKMFVAQQFSGSRFSQHALKESFRNIPFQQSLPVLGERAGIPHFIVHTQSHEPPEQQVVIQLFHQQPLTSHRIQHLQQQRPQQLLGCDRRPSRSRIEPIELRRELFQHSVYQASNHPQRMVLRYSFVG